MHMTKSTIVDVQCAIWAKSDFIAINIDQTVGSERFDLVATDRDGAAP